MSRTYTRTTTSTYTESRARYVMGKVYDDFIAMQNRGILSNKISEEWKEIIMWFMHKEALIFFEIQFSVNGKKTCALKYTLQDGDVFIDDNSGGVDYWDLPQNTNVSIFVSYDTESRYIDEIREKTKGWGTGVSLEDTLDSTDGNTYSKDCYGLKQKKIGW